MTDYDCFFSPSIAESRLNNLESQEYDLTIELAQNINTNATKLVNLIIKSDHAEGPIPNSRNFTNYATLIRNPDGSAATLMLTYSKRYQAPNSLHDLFENLVGNLNAIIDPQVTHPRINTIKVEYEPLSIKVLIALQ